MTGRSFRISTAAASLERSTNSVRDTPLIAAARSMTAKRSLDVRKFTWGMPGSFIRGVVLVLRI